MNPNPSSPDLARRQFLRRFLVGGGFLTASSAIGYGGYWAPDHPVLEQRTITLPNWPAEFDGLRVAFLSDLHIQPGFGPERLAPALKLARESNPDVVLLGGDYCNETVPNREEWQEICANALKGLAAPLGVYAIFGNHDYPQPPFDPVLTPWKNAGIVPLNDEIVSLSRNGSQVYLIGLRSVIARPYRMFDVVAKLPVTAPKVFLLHEPAYAPENDSVGGVLMLSGHTHGGQIVIPGIGPPILPSHSNGYRSGLYKRETKQMLLYVTRGVGLLAPRIRLFCPPEVTLLTLRCQ